MPNGVRRGGFSPLAVARAYREEFPGKFDEFDDAALIKAIEAEDPDTYRLIDPRLYGAELLAPIRPPSPPQWHPPMRTLRGGKIPDLAQPLPLPTPQVQPTGMDLVLGTGARVVPAILGNIAAVPAAAAAGVTTAGLSAAPTYAAVSGAFGAAGEALGQAYEKRMGLREAYNPELMTIEAAYNALPFAWARHFGRTGRIAAAAGQGAFLGGASLGTRVLLEEERVPTAAEVALGAGAGLGFGLGTGAAAEAIGATRQALRSTASTEYGLPTTAPPPSPFARLQHAQTASVLQELDRRAQEAEITTEFVRRGWEVPPERKGTLSYGMEQRDYLEELARLQQTPVAIPEIGPTAPPRAPAGLLPPGRPPSIEVFPPDVPVPPRDVLTTGGVPPRIQMPSTLDRLTDELDRGLASGGLEGPPRLAPPSELHLTAPPARPVALGAMALPLEETPPAFGGRLRQAPGRFQEPAPGQPRLPAVDRPVPLDRIYPEGPNAGPRQEGELHGRPRPRAWKRQIRTPGGVRMEYADSPLPAEDPGTYSPEVRRELASMLWELENFRYERVSGGVTRRQLQDMVESGAAATTGDAVRILRQSGATAGGAIPGAPVYHEIIAAARGPFAHATREEIQQALQQAVRAGKGSVASDAAAQVARGRLAQRATGQLTGGRYRIVAQRGDEGDDLIGWVDETGARALPPQDLDEWQRMAREADDAEVIAAWDAVKRYGIPEELRPAYEAMRAEAIRRGLRRPRQGGFFERLGGEEGIIKPDLLFGEEGDEIRPPQRPGVRGFVEGMRERGQVPTPPRPGLLPDEIEKRLAQPPRPEEPFPQPEDVPLPGLEQVRETEVPTSEIEAPFALTPPPAKPVTPPKQPGLFERLKGEEGVLILDIPAGDRTGLRRWLKQREAQHGGEPWYSRVEQAIDDGDWDKAWKVAAGASVRSAARAFAQAKTPQQQAAVEAALRGTPLDPRMEAQIIAGARAREGDFPRPPAGFPPSPVITQAGAARGRARLGPAGIVEPGPPQRPLSATAPALRAGTLDVNVMKLILEETTAEGKATIPGSQNTMDRIFRQIGEDVYVGKNLRKLREAGVHIPAEELAQHFNATVSSWGRGLNLLRQFTQANQETLGEAAERISFGGMFRRLAGREGPPPPRVGAGGRVLGTQAQEATAALIAQESTVYHQNMIANTLQKRAPIGMLRAVHDASYPLMLMRWSTAVRDYVSTQGRYTVDSLVHALTIPIAALSGDVQTARLSQALFRERGLFMVQKGAALTPRRAWQEDLQDMFDLSVGALSSADPRDVRHFVKLLTDIPEAAAHFLGGMGGENLRMVTAEVPVLRHITNPKVQRVISSFRRAQEISGRVVVGSASLRALVRVKGFDPDVLLRQPTPEIVQAVGGQDAWEDLLYASTAQSLEATFAGQLSKDSIPGGLVRFLNTAWPLKLGIPFPKFNFSSAPRWLFDHSALALVDLLRFPLDAAGWTAPKGTMAGGRLFRGTRAQRIERHMLPGLELEIRKAERQQGRSIQELLATQSEWEVRQRQIRHLQKMMGSRPPEALPGLTSRLDAATEARDQLARRRDRIVTDREAARQTVGDFKAEQKTLLAQLEDARGINAPNFSQYLARIAVGTVGLTGAALIVRAQPEAAGTRWYQYPIPNEYTGRRPDEDPVMMDFRPFAPFVQHLFVADVLLDFERHMNWDAYRAQVGEEAIAGPIDRLNAIWDNYEGKYTEAELGAQFAQAFLSISRAAGTTLTITDLLTQNGWPSLQDAADAIIGTMGQFLSRATVGIGQIKDILGAFDPEEAKVRVPPRPTREEPERPLAAPFGNIPYVSRVIPERVNQLTGEAVAANYPLMRAIFGIGTSSPGFIEQERLRIGLPGQTVYIRETGDYGLDRLVAETYSGILQRALPQILEDAYYRGLGTPARQRDFMQRYVFPELKRAALGEVRASLGEARFEAATVRGEEARRRRRVETLLEELGPEPQAEEPPPPPSFADQPPPPPF